jgi:nucleoside-diphosphate-sugar epimerase
MVFNLFPRSKWLRDTQDLAAQTRQSGPARIFLTGATGFVGGAIAAALADTGNFKEMLFLVRARSAAEGAQRVRQSIARFTQPGAPPPEVSEQQVIVADLSDADAFADARLDAVSHVIHSAAITSFADRPAIWTVNVDATMRLAERFSRVAGLRRFVYVGAAMACGVARGPLVTETLHLPLERAHLVPYTESKARAENQLRERFPELPLVALRPSIIVGHSALGCKPSASIFWLLKVVSQLNSFVCPPSAYLDIVPVDYCASTIVALTLKPTLAFPVYHISAGQDGSATVGELLQAFRQTEASGQGQPYQRVTEAALKQMVQSFGATAQEAIDTRMLHKALTLYGRFSRLNYIFDQRRILSEGMPPAPSFLDYLVRCDHSARGLTLKAQMACDFK